SATGGSSRTTPPATRWSCPARSDSPARRCSSSTSSAGASSCRAARWASHTEAVADGDPAELEARGLYDPRSPHAGAQLGLLRYLLSLRASVDELAARGEDPVGLAVARANAEAAALLPFVGSALDTLLRQHLLPARRTILGDAVDTGYETQRLAVGFVDLVGSTGLAQRLSTRE